jgi:hypothetical protein
VKNGERAYCPLCGNGPDSTFDNYEGYAVPVGLALHLLGRGKGHECAVFRVARARAQRGIEREVNKAVERRRRAAMPKKPNATAGGIAFFRASFRQESRFALGPS